MRTLLGIVCFGNHNFTELTLRAIRDTVKSEVSTLVVVGKPGDAVSINTAFDFHTAIMPHTENKGFPASLNDIYDWAFVNGEFDNVLFMGNDVVPYHGAIDAMIGAAESPEWEMFCASEFNSQNLVARYPEARKYFAGPNLNFTDFSARPWELHKDFRSPGIEPNTMKDIRNMTLFKRSVFEKIGYADVNFWPGGYFEDNDYCTRAMRAGVKACGLPHAAFFHFWSRTIHQGSGSTAPAHFQRNELFYQNKWGGGFGNETFTLPFGGHSPDLGASGIKLPATLKISDRADEARIIEYWRTR